MSINIPIRPFKRICFFTGFYRFTNFTTPKSITQPHRYLCPSLSPTEATISKYIADLATAKPGTKP